MRQIRLSALLFTILSLVVFILPKNLLAQTNFRQGEVTTLEEGEVIDDNYFAAGELVNIGGTVNGDAYLAGGNIVIEGTVNGDLITAGGMVNINGSVLGNVRAAGGQITISGSVGKNITAAGGQITISESAKVGGSLTGAAGIVEINSPIGKGVQVGSGNLTIANSVSGNITYAGDTLLLTPNAKVDGDITYFSEKDAQISKGALVSGKLTKNLPPKETSEAQKAVFDAAPKLITFWTIISLVSMLLLGLVVIRLAPNYVKRTAQRVREKFLASLGIGFLGFALTPILVVILFITILGIPLALILLFLYALMLYVSKLFAAAFLGQIIRNRFLPKQNLYVAFLIGLAIFYLLSFVPFVGWLVQFILVLAAIGALLVEKKALHHSLTQKKLL